MSLTRSVTLSLTHSRSVTVTLTQSLSHSAHSLTLSPQSNVLPEKLLITQLIKKSPNFYETYDLFTLFKRAQVSLIESTTSYPVSLRPISVLYAHLCRVLPSCSSIQIYRLNCCKRLGSGSLTVSGGNYVPYFLPLQNQEPKRIWIVIYWVMPPCSLVGGSQRFGGTTFIFRV